MSPWSWNGYVVEDPVRAGRGLVAIEVPDMDEAVATWTRRWPTWARAASAADPSGRGGDGARKAVATEPQGNPIALIGVDGV